MNKLLEDIKNRMKQIRLVWFKAVDKKDTAAAGQMWARFQELDSLKRRLEKELNVAQEKIELTREETE